MFFKKKYILFVFVLCSIFSCRQKREVVQTVTSAPSKSTVATWQNSLGMTNGEIKNSKLYSFVTEWYGTPYKYGGCAKSGVDCSCFTDILYETVYGRKTARSSSEIMKACDKVNAEKIREGDLVFFITNGKSVSHVGVYLKKDFFVHSSTGKGVIISSLNEAYYKKNFYSAGRLKHSS